MTVSVRSQILRFVSSTVAILTLLSATALAFQEKISPLSDYMYKKDYAQYESIKKEADQQKRADLLLAFVKERPISRILYYATTDYLESTKSYSQQKDYAKVISMVEAFQAVVPSEKAVKAENIPVGVEDFLKNQLAPTQKALLSGLMAAYYQSGNLAKAAETGERLYAMAPDKSLLIPMTDIYQKSNNEAKYLAYAEKVLANYPIDQYFGTALQVAEIYLKKQNIDKATELLTKVMDVYGDKVPPNVQESAWNTTRAFSYNIIAAGVYAKKDYQKAMGLYQKVTRFDPKNGDAYYYIGMCKWNNKDQEGAIEAFAKTVVIGKGNAAKAQQYLEDLYKAAHEGSLDGLDEVLSKAKSELGIG